jgi:hypothetical protein
MGPPPKLNVLIPKNRVDANTTEDLSARRAKNTHRDMKKDRRFNPCAGEEVGYSSESGNEREDYENSQYDNRMVPADKKVRAELLEWKIKKIKTNVLPKEFTTQRQNALQKAQAEFEKTGVFPVYLHGVKPPWDIGVGLAYTRYNEWILTELERQLSILRERNAQTCALEDASKNTDGPMGRGHRYLQPKSNHRSPDHHIIKSSPHYKFNKSSFLYLRFTVQPINFKLAHRT